MENEKESFVFYKSFYDALQDLKDKDRLKVYDAICEMALNGNERNLTGISKTVFTLIKPQVLANNRRYENGKKGGRPKKETIGFEKNKTIGYLKTETKTKPNVNVNVNVNENVNANVNENDLGFAVADDSCVDDLQLADSKKVGDSCVDGLQEVIGFYENNIGLISPYIVEILQDFLNEMDSEVLIYAMKRAVEADKRTIQYIKGILNNWSKKGITTVLEAQKEIEDFRSKKTKSKEETEEERLSRKTRELEEALKNDKW